MNGSVGNKSPGERFHISQQMFVHRQTGEVWPFPKGQVGSDKVWGVRKKGGKMLLDAVNGFIICIYYSRSLLIFLFVPEEIIRKTVLMTTICRLLHFLL